jgi:hydroxymethylpyrimidine/phosphomethylpyrimidine kinase
MLGDAAVAEAVGRFLTARRPPVVVLDPVMVATSGDPLLDPAAVDGLRALLPLTDLVTPNVPEAATLLGVPPATDERGLHEQAEAVVALGARRVLLKGGHLAGDESIDVLAGPEGVHAFRAPRIATTSTHGTGCTLSSALAALRPQRPDWLATVADAKAYLTDALRRADELQVGAGHGPVHHFARLWP